MSAPVTALQLLLAALLIILTGTGLRILYILPITRSRHAIVPLRRSPAHLLIVLGSGGHTAEMLSILRNIDPNHYAPRTYVVSSGDDFSASKASQFEKMLLSRCTHGYSERFEIKTVPRARKVHQPLHRTPLSLLRCLLACMKILAPPGKGRTRSPSGVPIRMSPDLIVTNGPATGVIVVLASLITRFLGWQGTGEMRIIYVESWARVRSLSLSGKILLWGGLTDRFLVQWEALKGGRAEWRGFLIG